jgi:hypothetical protein
MKMDESQPTANHTFKEREPGEDMSLELLFRI